MKKELQSKGDYVKGSAFIDYVTKCVEICWFSCIQDPPLVFDSDLNHGDEFDDAIMKTYTKKGSEVDFIVWPVLKLCENGAILAKGVVQPIDEKKAKTNAA